MGLHTLTDNLDDDQQEEVIGDMLPYLKLDALRRIKKRIDGRILEKEASMVALSQRNEARCERRLSKRARMEQGEVVEEIISADEVNSDDEEEDEDEDDDEDEDEDDEDEDDEDEEDDEEDDDEEDDEEDDDDEDEEDEDEDEDDEDEKEAT